MTGCSDGDFGSRNDPIDVKALVRHDGTVPMSGDLDMDGNSIIAALNITATNTGTFGESVVVDSNHSGNPAGLTLSGWGPGGDQAARGGKINWEVGTGGAPGLKIAGYTYVNLNNQLVFDATVQTSGADKGNAWVELDTGLCSFAGGTFGRINDYSEFEADGTLVFKGDATVWKDIQFPISSGKVGQANQPSWSTFTTNTNEYQFTVGDFIDLRSNELIHGWEEGSVGHFHAHVTTDAANETGSSRYVKLTVYVGYQDSTGAWVETSVTGELEIVDGTGSLQGFKFDLGTVDFTGIGIESQIKPKVTRIAATGGTEYADEIFINQIGCHVKCDTVGSRTQSGK